MDITDSEIQPLPRYQSYRDYVQHLQNEWPELTWLDQFLNTEVPTNDTTTVGICDLIQDKLVYNDYSGDLRRLEDDLHNNPRPSKLRVVILTHVDSWTVDRQVLDVIGRKLDLEPRVYLVPLQSQTIPS